MTNYENTKLQNYKITKLQNHKITKLGGENGGYLDLQSVYGYGCEYVECHLKLQFLSLKGVLN